MHLFLQETTKTFKVQFESAVLVRRQPSKLCSVLLARSNVCCYACRINVFSLLSTNPVCISRPRVFPPPQQKVQFQGAEARNLLFLEGVASPESDAGVNSFSRSIGLWWNRPSLGWLSSCNTDRTCHCGKPGVCKQSVGYFLFMALRPNAGHGVLIREVSRSHTTHRSRWDSSGQVISLSQRPLHYNTHKGETSMPPQWN